MKFMRLGWIIVLLLCAGVGHAQDAVFSQFYNSTLYLNPAMAGIEDDPIVTMTHRTQWAALLFPYTTTQFSLILPYHESKHTKPFGHKGGFGVSFYNDVAGQDNNFKTTGANFNYAYNLPLDHEFVNVLSFGVQAGYIQKRIDTSTLQWGEQYDPFIGFNQNITPTEVVDFQNRGFFDSGVGVFWWYNPLPKDKQVILSMNSGISASHLNSPNESLLDYNKSRLPILYKYHGGILFGLSHNWTLSLNTLVAFQNRTAQGNFGSYLSYRFFTASENAFAESVIRIGGWYRVKDAAIFLTEFENTKFKVAFSYDLNTSSLRYADRGIGSYEIFFSYKFTSHSPPKSRY